MGGVPSVPEKESVMVLVLPTLFATAAQIWVLPSCLGALPKQSGWRHRCRSGGGSLEGVDNGGRERGGRERYQGVYDGALIGARDCGAQPQR